MKPLEIYKLLPKTNCGECIPGKCMSFAISLGGNPGYLRQCRHIGPERIAEIKSLTGGDWRDDLVKSLSEEVSKINFYERALHLGCAIKDDALTVRCIGRDYIVSKDGNISPDTDNKWIKILLLHYVRIGGKGEFMNKWISFSEIKDGFVKASTFLRDCEEPLRRLMDEDPAGTVSILERLGASRITGLSSDYSLQLDLLPNVRTLILYHRGDEEFPSSLKILFDGITERYLDVESLIFLCEGLVHTITYMRRHERTGPGGA